MTNREFAAACDLRILVEGDPDRGITGGYCGDLLSWVMGRAKEGDAWFTVMGNVNAIAVATLADTACIVLVEDSPLDDAAKMRAQQQDVTILQSGRTAYELAAMLHGLLNKDEII